MRQGYQQIPKLDAEHNEQHRKCYQTPYFPRTVTSYPGVDDMELNEEVLYVNSTVSAIRCVKISSTKVVSAGLT